MRTIIIRKSDVKILKKIEELVMGRAKRKIAIASENGQPWRDPRGSIVLGAASQHFMRSATFSSIKGCVEVVLS